ncbi:hypothetical protein Nocox_21505 [Nonomuraea coxensis DSM 45129]|uniref:Uncharacterized protein n=1 Tax=Nonomuraea coxensis DSM 45129 TaxID=1122611 RepID=A0ABX8U2E4_9ACTN|nr:hypothetical protein Nocox_21505 [Nonomuraea coxensis DSM 45129]
MKRRSTCSASAVPSRKAVAYLTIWSYCWAMIVQSIGLSATMPLRLDGTWPLASALTSFWWAILLIRDSSLNPSR